jgi:hypothetical protein
MSHRCGANYPDLAICTNKNNYAASNEQRAKNAGEYSKKETLLASQLPTCWPFSFAAEADRSNDPIERAGAGGQSNTVRSEW